jgi:hypothetical protein
MTPTLALLILVGAFVLILWVAVSKAGDDGFFNSICTALVIFSAFQFVNWQWPAMFHFLQRELGLSGAHGVSTSYWLCFILVIAPGLIVSKILSNPKVPFPKSVEQYGSMLAGALVGLLLFATVVQSLARFGFFADLQEALRPFRILFAILGSRWVGVDAG